MLVVIVEAMGHLGAPKIQNPLAQAIRSGGIEARHDVTVGMNNFIGGTTSMVCSSSTIWRSQ